jgi:hypothetical protein
VDRLLHHAHAEQASGAETLRAVARAVPAFEEEVARAAAAIDGARDWRALWREELGRGAAADGPAEVLARELERARSSAQQRSLFPLPEGLAAPGPVVRSTTLLDCCVTRSAIELGVGGSRIALAGWIGTTTWSEAELAVLAVRHGVPGQALLFAARARQASEVRRRLGTTAVLTGWGLYAEEVMRESGFFDPRQRFVQRALLYRRAVVGVAGLRVRSDLLALRGSWRQVHGAGSSLLGFHDEVLRFPGFPPTLIRWGLGLDA